MPYRQIDPARLEGEALRRWYMRSSDEIQKQREAAEARQHAEFFGSGNPAAHLSRLSYLPGAPDDDPILDYGLADGFGGGEFIEIGSRTRKHRRDWERKEGRPWPTTEEGANFHAHHKDPKADGGSDTLDNIEPKHPVPHKQDHVDKGDFRRWGSRSRKGKGAGPPAPKPRGPTVRGLGALGLIPNAVGLLTGSIRTDTFDNFIHDMLGMPSQEDLRREYEEHQRMLNPNWKPGDPMRV